MRHPLLAAAALFLFAVVTAAAADKSPKPTSVDRAKKGINAIEKLLNIFTSKIFDDEDFAGVMDLFSKILSFVGAILGFFGNQGESAEMKFMRKQFAELHSRLDSISLQLGDVKQLIDWTGTRMMYHELEQHVLTSSNLFDSLMKTDSDQEKGFWRRRFLDHFKRNRQSAYNLYQAVAENDYVIGQNLAKAAVHFTGNHKPKVMSFLLDIQRLVLRGAQMQIAYERMEHSEAAAKRMEAIWNDRMAKLTRKLKSVNDEVKNAYHNQLQQDVRRIIIDGRNSQNKDFVGPLYRFLVDKYPWRHWFTLAYQNVGGWDNHAITHCGSSVHFRVEGDRNVVVASSDQKSSRFNRANAINVLNAVDGTVRNRHAKDFMDAINRRLNSNYCSTAALRAAVCWGCNVWYMNTNRVVYKKMTAQRGGHMNTFLFG